MYLEKHTYDLDIPRLILVSEKVSMDLENQEIFRLMTFFLEYRNLRMVESS